MALLTSSMRHAYNMENRSAKNITDFINAFGLKDGEGLTIFKAGIVLRIADESKTTECEVHVITSDDLMAVYLFGDNIDGFGIRDMFRADAHEFVYVPWQCLNINTEKNNAPATISIFPKLP
jgi:hypothetical protein